MRFGDITCHEINSQYQLKNTSYFHHNGLMVKGYSYSQYRTIHTNNTSQFHKIHSSALIFYAIATSGIKMT